MLIVSLNAESCFMLVRYYKKLTVNEQKVYLAGLQDRVDFEIQNAQLDISPNKLQKLLKLSKNIENIRLLIKDFIKQHKKINHIDIDNFCMNGIYDYVILTPHSNSYFSKDRKFYRQR